MPIRASGSAVFVAPVIANAANVQVQGTATGLPVVSLPSTGALTSGSNAAGAAAKTAEFPTGAAGNREQASVFLVEIVGYGGGDASQPKVDTKDQSSEDEKQQSDAKKRGQ